MPDVSGVHIPAIMGAVSVKPSQYKPSARKYEPAAFRPAIKIKPKRKRK